MNRGGGWNYISDAGVFRFGVAGQAGGVSDRFSFRLVFETII